MADPTTEGPTEGTEVAVFLAGWLMAATMNAPFAEAPTLVSEPAFRREDRQVVPFEEITTRFRTAAGHEIDVTVKYVGTVAS